MISKHLVCTLFGRSLGVGGLVLVLAAVFLPMVCIAQEITPEMLEAASRQTGLSKEELLRRYEQEGGQGTAGAENTSEENSPGRQELGDIDDRMPWRDTNVQVILPFSGEEGADKKGIGDQDSTETIDDSDRFFGSEFFKLDSGVFDPPSFGPLSGEYRLGIGDEIIINVWGGVDFQLTRIVDRDGAIILPKAGKIVCAGRTLDELDQSLRERLAQLDSSIDVDGADGEDEGDTFVEITLGHLRAIRVFVVGEVHRPGSFELSSVSTILTALYAAGGPSDQGSYRDIRLMRGESTVAHFDIYQYLMGGNRRGDAILQEGDTVFIPSRGPSTQILGAVKRPMNYEIMPGQNLTDLINYAGGFTSLAASDVIHIQRILPPEFRSPGHPDKVFLDIAYDVGKMEPKNGSPAPLLGGDEVTIDGIDDRLENWVQVSGSVKRPGKYEFLDGMTVVDLVDLAGGLWPDALSERAVIDRTSPEKMFSSISVALSAILSGTADPVLVQPLDELRVFSRWDAQTRPQVHITGEVFDPLTIDFREGMTLRDLVLKAGGLKDSANLMQADVSRLIMSAVQNPDVSVRPERTVEILNVSLGSDFLTADESLVLMPHDRVAVRRLPWWESQSTVTVNGEVFYPGTFSLERKDERISSVIARAGGLRPDAYLIGARVNRIQDSVGNIALDLMQALAQPGSQYDIILQDGDEILIPDRMFTVKVEGEVGFPTSLIFEEGKDINYYVHRAGGYLNKSDKKRARVVYPNGLSLPNKGGSKVVAGSTIIVPIKPPPEGKSTMESVRDITGIIASLAMVWLVIDSTTN
jgi:protein involved in polysaccharide export with SLBB domain